MNCNHFRFLIQQSFDVEISSEDEQQVSAHLDSCQSCVNFLNYLNQIIESANVLPLPEDVLPENLEKSFQFIIQELPRAQSPVAKIFNHLFGGIANSIKNKDLGIELIKQKLSTLFTHLKGRTGDEQNEIIDEQATSTARLRGLSRHQYIEHPTQSSARSLGEKFGITQSSEPLITPEGPSTLAESIKRKLTEDRSKQDELDVLSNQSNAETQSPANDQTSANWGQLPSDFQPQPTISPEQSGAWSGNWNEPPVETGFVQDNTSAESSPSAFPGSTSQANSTSTPGGTPVLSNQFAPPSSQSNPFDIPIQERLKSAQAANESAIPTDSIINRLSNVLGEASSSSAESAQIDRFDTPIQERTQLPSAAPSPEPIDEHWDVPIQEKLKQTAQQSASAAPPVSPESSLFKNLDDATMDRLFSENLGVNVSAKPVTPVSKMPAAPSAEPTTTPPIPTAAPTPSAASPVPTAPPSKSGGIFEELNDSAMDLLFNQNLGINESSSNMQVKPQTAQTPVPPQSIQPTPTVPSARSVPSTPPPALPSAPPVKPAQTAPSVAAQAAPAQPAPPAAKSTKNDSLFDIDDNAIDKIFADNLGVKDITDPTPKPSKTPAAQAVPETAETAPSKPVKIEGVGRLDTKTDSTADSGTGKIAAIGKFLLDQQDLTKIGDLTTSDLSNSKMRILTVEAAQEIQTLLQHVNKQSGVLGSVIVGHDGILIANSMPAELDPESTGIWALGIYLNTDSVMKKLGHNQVHQIVAKTLKGYLIVADFGGGILVTLTDSAETEKLIPLMRSITQLVSS